MRGLRAAQPAAEPRYRAHGVGASFGTSGVVRRVELGSVGCRIVLGGPRSDL